MTLAWQLKSIIRKYSDHISLPILMNKEEWDEEKKETVQKDELETVNQASALWTRSKSDITRSSTTSSTSTCRTTSAPLALHPQPRGRPQRIHPAAVHPGPRPFDLWDRNKRGGIKLYVKRVFIMDDAEQLMPTYLRFVKA
jgi:molecular chaperone HtpG